jgi:hypothetical protein
MPKLLICGKGLVIIVTRPFPQSSDPLHRASPSMIPPDQINGLHHTDRTLSATVHAISSYRASWNAQEAETIVNTSERLRTRPNGEPKRIGS